MSLIKHYTVTPFAYTQTQLFKGGFVTAQFINSGTNTVILMQLIPLLPGQTFTVEGNENEICNTDIQITFQDTGGTNLLTGVVKSYTTS